MHRSTLPLSLSLLLAAPAAPIALGAPSGQPVRMVVLDVCVSEKSPARIEAELTTPLERELRDLPDLDSFASVSMEYGVTFMLQFTGGAKEAHRANTEEMAKRSPAGQALGVRYRAARLTPPHGDGYTPTWPCQDAPPPQA